MIVYDGIIESVFLLKVSMASRINAKVSVSVVLSEMDYVFGNIRIGDTRTNLTAWMNMDRFIDFNSSIRPLSSRVVWGKK